MIRTCALTAALLLASCVQSPLVTPSSTPSASTSTEIPKCSSARLTFLVEEFFARYDAREIDGFLALFNWATPAAGGGFESYYDNPGQEQEVYDQASLAMYIRGRWALGDRFFIASAGPYPEGSSFPKREPDRRHHAFLLRRVAVG
jgi:hypothetical protein